MEHPRGRATGRRRGRRLATTLALVAAITAGTLAAATTGVAAEGAGATRVGAAAPSAPRRQAGRRAAAITRQVTMNIAFGMGPARHRADVLRTTHGADVIGWQEIHRRSQTRAIRHLRSRGWRTYWPGGKRRDGRVWRYPTNAGPISWRHRKWKLLRTGRRLSTRGIDGVCPDRYLTFVVLRHRGSGKRIVRWNIHFVPNALNKQKVRHKAARKAAWYRQAGVVQKFLDDFKRKGHAAVIGGGDINSWYVDFAGDRVSYDTDHRGVDYLTHIPSGRVHAWNPRFIEMKSDHDKVRVGYTLYR